MSRVVRVGINTWWVPGKQKGGRDQKVLSWFGVLRKYVSLWSLPVVPDISLPFHLEKTFCVAQINLFLFSSRPFLFITDPSSIQALARYLLFVWLHSVA